MRLSFLRHPALLLICGFAAMAAHAQVADPMRPAPEWLAAQSRAPGAPAPAEAATPEVQIVVVGPTRKFALVNGEAVYAGDSYNGSRLAEINRDGVVWQRGGAQHRSGVNPDVRKAPSGSPDAAPQSPNIRKKVLN